MSFPEELLSGNRDFANSGFDFERISAGQHARFVVIACADARVSPEIVFGRPLDTLFVVRNAGALLGAEELASIQYAIEHIPTVEGIIYMAHTRCGLINAALSSENFEGVLGRIISKVRAQIGKTDEAGAIAFEISRNVKKIKRLEKKYGKKIPIFGIIYHTENGSIEQVLEVGQ